jgi:hypothetical protein
MIERSDNPSPETKPDATAKKPWVDPEIEVLPATEAEAGPPGPNPEGFTFIS